MNVVSGDNLSQWSDVRVTSALCTLPGIRTNGTYTE